MATRTIRISKQLYLKIKAAARKNKRTIRAQAEYWIQLGMAAEELRTSRWKLFFEEERDLSALLILIQELQNFASKPSKESAKLCRAIIDELQPLGQRNKKVAKFLERADQIVARPYLNAPRDIAALIKWYQG